MRIVSVIILPIFVAQGHVADQDFMDQLSNKLIQKLSDRLFASDLDGTTLAKTHPDMSPSMNLGKAASGSALGRAALPAILPRPVSPSSIASRPQVRVDAMPGSYMQPTAATSPVMYKSVAPTQGSQPSVASVQDTLKRHGFATSPMQKLALTAIAATRDTSMKAQVREVFESMDSKDQSKVMAEIAADSVKATDLPGITAPLGFWDPLGFSAKSDFNDGKDDTNILYYRDLELKHGRIGMLAFLGMVSGELLSPLFGGPPNVPSVFMWQETTTDIFWPWVVTAIGIHEVLGLYKYDEEQQKWDVRPASMDGHIDYGFDPLGLKPKDPKAYLEMQNKEINNGRLAMLAAAGIIAQEQVTGTKIFR